MADLNILRCLQEEAALQASKMHSINPTIAEPERQLSQKEQLQLEIKKKLREKQRGASGLPTVPALPPVPPLPPALPPVPPLPPSANKDSGSRARQRWRKVKMMMKATALPVDLASLSEDQLEQMSMQANSRNMKFIV